ncbi:unnamed protein product [Rotaria sp. Silwood2]|nr:unnamed protein product [Rotaria sp. Silwood2]CAF2837820.1 unnamed protein product [Rotaria sp. Silwood2]CAF3079250.1 unnamed protein product [Rotaria sp. Silwood2]CAF3302379.1 unnamed protein product [Rotaria sp. Silwood2]CAF4025948.1 unnamed protein product [Rotaria sp. Silwood2]
MIFKLIKRCPLLFLYLVKSACVMDCKSRAASSRQLGNEKITVKFHIANTVSAAGSGQETEQTNANTSQPSVQLKLRLTFTVDINRGRQTLSFLCSYLADDYPDVPEQYQGGENENNKLEDFQIDEFAIHDGELYDTLLNLLEEHSIGES